MKRVLFFVIHFLLFCNARAQVSTTANTEVINYYTVDLRPEFLGPNNNFTTFFAKNFSLPDYEGSDDILKIGFIIEIDGTVSDIKILKKTDEYIQEQVKKVINKCPKWNAGEHNEKPVRVYYEFSLKLTGSN